MNVKFKKLNKDAITPFYAKDGDAGMDLTAITKSLDRNITTYGTGLAFEIPKGFAGFLFPRSSVYRVEQSLANCIGLVDSGYRGEIMFKFRSTGEGETYEIGDRIGQIVIMPHPEVELEEVQELETSERSLGGYGSTGF